MHLIKEKLEFIRENTHLMNLEEEEIVGLLWKIIESTDAPITLTDHLAEDEPIIYCNRAFEDLTGYSYSEVIGKNCRFLQGEDTDPEQVAEIDRSIAEGRSTSVTILNYKKDGKTFWNKLFLNPVSFDDGVHYYMGVLHDLSDGK